MGLQLTSSDQVLALAPDTDSAKNGKKLGNAKSWKSLGQNAEALWGECQGSGKDPYQVRVDLSTLTMTCSCPSRKSPCKHALGLLLIAVEAPKAIATVDAPEWVSSWLAKRAATAKRKEAKETEKPADVLPSAAQIKNAERRLSRVMNGIDRLDLWMNDIIRNGLSSVAEKPASFWEDQGKQMVDAQAGGLKVALYQMSPIPNSSPDWPEKLLARMGKLALLTHSFHQIDTLAPSLQEDLRQLVVGKPLEQNEIAGQGETVSDDWIILGQRLTTSIADDKVREQWTWLIGANTRRQAYILQFAFGQTPFKDVFPVGTHQDADFTFYPGTSPIRAQLAARRGEILPLTEGFPAAETIEDFLAGVSAILIKQPWQERFLCTLKSVIPVCEEKGQRWYIRDTAGMALPLRTGEHWQLLAIAGGMPVDFAAEWDGETLHPLGILVQNKYYVL